MFSTSLLSGRHRLHATCVAAVFAFACTLSVHAAVIDSQLTISVRAYASFDRRQVDFHAARAQVEAAFRPTGIRIEWLDCQGQWAPAHCQSPPQVDEVVVRIVTATETPNGAFVPLGVSLVEPRTRTGCYATVYLDRVIALAKRVDVEAGSLLGRAVAHEIGHVLLGSSRHSSEGLMRKIWSPAELQRNHVNDWVFQQKEAAVIRAAVARRLAQWALALR